MYLCLKSHTIGAVSEPTINVFVCGTTSLQTAKSTQSNSRWPLFKHQYADVIRWFSVAGNTLRSQGGDRLVTVILHIGMRSYTRNNNCEEQKYEN